MSSGNKAFYVPVHGGMFEALETSLAGVDLAQYPVKEPLPVDPFSCGKHLWSLHPGELAWFLLHTSRIWPKDVVPPQRTDVLINLTTILSTSPPDSFPRETLIQLCPALTQFDALALCLIQIPFDKTYFDTTWSDLERAVAEAPVSEEDRQRLMYPLLVIRNERDIRFPLPDEMKLNRAADLITGFIPAAATSPAVDAAYQRLTSADDPQPTEPPWMYIPLIELVMKLDKWDQLGAVIFKLLALDDVAQRTPIWGFPEYKGQLLRLFGRELDALYCNLK